MGSDVRIDSTRREILEALRKQFGEGLVVPAKQWSPNENAANYNLIIEAANGGKFVIKPHSGVLKPGYICMAGCAAAVKTVSKLQAEAVVSDGALANKILVEVKVLLWRGNEQQALEGIVAAVNGLVDAPAVAKEKPVEVVAEKPKPAAPAVVSKKGDEGHEERIELLKGALSILGSPDNDFSYCHYAVRGRSAGLELLLTFYKPYSYRTTFIDMGFLDKIMERKGIDYNVERVKDWDADHFCIYMNLEDSYIAGSDVKEVARKIDSEIRELQRKIDIAYYHHLYEHVAKLNDITLGEFTAEQGRRCINPDGGNKTWRRFVLEGELADDLDSKKAPYSFEAKSKFCYWEDQGVFIYNNDLAYNSFADYEKYPALIKKRFEDAKALGFIISEGHLEAVFIIKPIGGNFDYDKNFPKLCEMMTYEYALIYDGKRLHEEIAQQQRRGEGRW